MPDNETVMTEEELEKLRADSIAHIHAKSDEELLEELKNFKFEINYSSSYSDKAKDPRRPYPDTGIDLTYKNGNSTGNTRLKYVGLIPPGYPVKIRISQTEANNLRRNHNNVSITEILSNMYHLNDCVVEVEEI